MTEFVTALPSHKLTPHESAVLLMVVNTVRAGFFRFQVTFTYNKVDDVPAPQGSRRLPRSARHHVPLPRRNGGRGSHEQGRRGLPPHCGRGTRGD